MRIFLLLLLLLVPACSFSETTPKTANYEEIVTYSKGQQISFPDFSLTFQNERTQELYHQGLRIPMGNCHDFLIVAGQVKKTICWSSGTGAIGPAHFLVAETCFGLERIFADRLGKLSANQLVISKAPREYCR